MSESRAATRPPREPVRRRKLHEDVAARIRELVAELGLGPGDRLPSERELMAEFGVGRSAVREAMLSLQLGGVVAVSSGERARVARPTARAMVGELAGMARHLLAQPRGVEQLLDARALLEEGLARLAAERAADGDLAMLAELLEANRRALGDPAAFLRADVAFHYGIASVARNDVLTALMEGMVGWLAGRGPAPADLPGSGEAAALAAHRRIHEAVAARDPEAAGRAMRAHLEAAGELHRPARRVGDPPDGPRGGPAPPGRS